MRLRAAAVLPQRYFVHPETVILKNSPHILYRMSKSPQSTLFFFNMNLAIYLQTLLIKYLPHPLEHQKLRTFNINLDDIRLECQLIRQGIQRYHRNTHFLKMVLFLFRNAKCMPKTFPTVIFHRTNFIPQSNMVDGDITQPVQTDIGFGSPYVVKVHLNGVHDSAQRIKQFTGQHSVKANIRANINEASAGF